MEVFSISCILILTKVTRVTDLDVTLYPLVGLVSGWDHSRFVQNNFFINVYKYTGLEFPTSIVLLLCSVCFILASKTERACYNPCWGFCCVGYSKITGGMCYQLMPGYPGIT